MRHAFAFSNSMENGREPSGQPEESILGPKTFLISLLNGAYFIFSRKEEGKNVPMGISCKWFRLRLSSLRDARSPICTGRCVISLQDASNCIRVFIFPISSGKLTSLLLLTIKPEKRVYHIISLFFFFGQNRTPNVGLSQCG